MNSQCRLIAIAALLALALIGPAPLAARANSLLSGYGGPGQGNQAILGATLLGAPPGGGEGGGGGRGTSAATGSLAIPATSGSGAGHAASRRHRAGSGAASAGGSVAATSAQTGGAYGSQLRPAVPEASVGSPTLGISGVDLLYILVGLGGLTLTGVLTRQLARRPR
jgi:hypothetical protein